MNRRDFIRRSVSLGALAGAAVNMPGFPKLFAYSSPLQDDKVFELAAIKGGEPDEMFARAINSLGGIEKFVKPNQTVVVKPNIGWDVRPELGADTNPKLVSEIIKQCLKAGAKKVYSFDHTCDNWTSCYTNSGIESAVKNAGGVMVPGNSQSYYQSVDIPKGKILTDAKVHELILESDVFINVPILKNHGGAKLTISMKNLMGAVWDRRYWHRNGLHQCISDFATLRLPDLNVVDAYMVMKRNGPRGYSEDDLVPMKTQIISSDIVAADAAAAKVFGMEPANVSYIEYADSMSAGTMNLQNLEIDRIKI